MEMKKTGEQEREKLVNAAVQGALDAGRAILEVYQDENFDVEIKKDKSPLTRADKQAHRVIVQALEQAGDTPILSEEGKDSPYADRKEWEQYWLVDPLDGTKEFIKRNGEFTVNIALMRAEEGRDGSEIGPGAGPAAGVVYVPVKDILYVGIGGQGAWKVVGAAAAGAGTVQKVREIGEPLGEAPYSGRPFTAVMSRSHNSPETEALVAEMEKTYGPAERVSSGSSIKLCLVAEGTADVYPRFAPTMEWDTAAGDAVCRAAGCRVTEQDGKTALRYNKENLLNPWFLVLGPYLEEIRKK